MRDRTVVRPAHRRERTPWTKAEFKWRLYSKFLRVVHRIRPLRLAGATLFGLFGALAVCFAVLGVLSSSFRHPDAILMWPLAVASLLVALFGLWVHSAE